MVSIKEGMIVKSSRWSEPLEIKLIQPVGEYAHIIGETTVSRDHVDQLIPEKELSTFEVVGKGVSFSEDPWKVFLALEAIRFRFASLYDPLLAMNTSKVDPLPHQIEGVYGYVLKLPRIRFLIADDPGAGKTIMAGLIVKELKIRNLIRRILIVAPGHLRDQWIREMKERFEERLTPIDRNFLNAFYGENAWMRENQIITSVDFAKQDDVLPSISSARFDFIVVDEAHKMSAYQYGDKVKKTDRYKLGEVLSKNTEHFLFLTATPHKGDPENYRLFLDLLHPGYFATAEMVNDSIHDKDNPLFIRRIKEDLKDFEGIPLFLPRNVDTVPIKWKTDSPNEQKLYNELSKYVEEQYNRALLRHKKRNIAFALVILQRRLASSTYALLRSLERRRKRLKDLLEGTVEQKKDFESRFDFDEYEDRTEEERWKEEEIWETLSVAENRQELQKEIEILKALIVKARMIIENEEEQKLKELRSSLESLSGRFESPEKIKILVFTESKDTMDYLEKRIRSWGYSVNTIHGRMRLEDRVNAETVFKNETQILVATEAAGEGINLQFCHLMINYDLPWNPNRLEQRMGRIHRYGQTKEVFIFNLVAVDSREGKVLKRLFEKLDEIRAAMGSDKVFDVITEVLYDQNLSQLLIDAASNARNITDILREIDVTVDEEYIGRVKENLGESLATRFIDYTRIKEMAQSAREHRLIPEYTEGFFKKALVRFGAKYRELIGGFLAVDSIPFEIRKIAEDDQFKRSFGGLLRKYPKITFDKDVAFKDSEAVFVTFGHPLFEAVMRWIERNLSESLLNGATFEDPDGKLDGYIFFYEGEIRDGTGKIAGKRLFSYFLNEERQLSVAPSIIWDLEEGKASTNKTPDMDALKSQAASLVIRELEKYRDQLQDERQRQADIKNKYGVNSLDYLIVKLDGELIDLNARREKGENVDLPIHNKRERKAEYEIAKKELLAQIEKEKSLTMTMPRFLGVIRAQPPTKVAPAMRSDAEIERIGMDVAMQFERNNGRKPEDVSEENLGFDIRSEEPDGSMRYVEVKARARTDDVALTQNEWFKARRFQDDYYLYTVLNAGSKPELYVVRNPAANFQPEERIELVRYIISHKDVKNMAEAHA